jgi:hypothetical protein
MNLPNIYVESIAEANLLLKQNFLFQKRKRSQRYSAKKFVRSEAIKKEKVDLRAKKLAQLRKFEAMALFFNAIREHRFNPDNKWILDYGFCGSAEFADKDDNGKVFRRKYLALITDVEDYENHPGELLFHVR